MTRETLQILYSGSLQSSECLICYLVFRFYRLYTTFYIQ